MSDSWTHHRATIGALRRNGRPADDPDVLNAQRDLRAAKLADHIKRVVDASPRLTTDQRDRLALLLRGPSDGGAAA